MYNLSQSFKASMSAEITSGVFMRHLNYFYGANGQNENKKKM